MLSYSKYEQVALTVLRRAKNPVDTNVLVERIYKGREAPFNARKSILGLMTALARKVQANEETFAIRRTERAGPKPVKFWIE